MADPENTSFELPEESAAALAEIAKEQRAWVLACVKTAADSHESERMAYNVRRRVLWLLRVTEFFGKLDKAREKEEIDHLLEYDLGRGLDWLQSKEIDLADFPDRERIVTEALMRRLIGHVREPGAVRTWIYMAIDIKVTLGRGLAFNDSRVPGYTDAWKQAFIWAIQNNENLAMSIANITHGEVNLREIPNYEQLVKDRYYHLMLSCHVREDEVLKGSLGQGLDFFDRNQKIVERMAECLNDVRDWTVIDILYILKKFGNEVHFGPNNIPNFEGGVKTAFLFCLQNRRRGVSAAKEIKNGLGSGINFDDEVRAGLVYNLGQYKDHEGHWFTRALAIKEELGSHLNLSADPESKRSIVRFFMKMLQAPSWRMSYIVTLKEKLGTGIEFSDATVPGYAAVVQGEFLRHLREGEPADAILVRDHFGQGVALDAGHLSDYKTALHQGFTVLVHKVQSEKAKALTAEFEAGAEIEDKAVIVQGKFIDLLKSGEWRKAIELKEGFEPEIPCNREQIEGYDDSFRACLTHNFFRVTTYNVTNDVTETNLLCEKLGAGVDIIDVLRKLKDEDGEKFIQFAKREHWRAIFGDEAMDQFLAALPTRTDEKRNAFTHNSYDRATEFIAFLHRTGNIGLNTYCFARMTDFVRRFGLVRSERLYQCFMGLISQSWTQDGLKSVDDLEARVSALRQKVYGEKPLTDLSGLSPIELELFALVTGKTTHRFDAGNQRIEKIVADFSDAHAAGEIADVPEGYQVESIETSEVSIDFDPESVRANYQALRHEILESIEHPEEVSGLAAQGLQLADEKLTVLSGQGSAPFAADQIKKLEALRERIIAAKDLDALMIALLETKFMGKKNPFYSMMRQIVFRKVFMKNRSPEALAGMLARLGGDEITGPNILEIIGIIDDVVKHHVLNLDGNNKEQYWGSEAWDALRSTRRDGRMVEVQKIFSPHIGSLRETAKKFKFNETGKTSTVRAIPDRGLVGEMSGYLADVCYTAEYPLLKPRPNLVPHKLVMGEGKEAQFFGSYLIFELEQDNGDKVMLVRGLNVPDEASIDVMKFIETTLDRLEASARRRGITKIVIPGVMGALTNYPLTKNYLFNRYIVGRQAIKLKERFNFNNYDLTENCFVAREIEPLQPKQATKRPRPRRPQVPPLAMTA